MREKTNDVESRMSIEAGREKQVSPSAQAAAASESPATPESESPKVPALKAVDLTLGFGQRTILTSINAEHPPGCRHGTDRPHWIRKDDAPAHI